MGPIEHNSSIRSSMRLSLEDPALKSVLMQGQLPSSERVVAQQVIADKVVFRIMQEASVPLQGPWKALLKSARVPSLSATLVPALVLCAYLAPMEGLAWSRTVMAALGALCLQLAVNFRNDLDDYLKILDMPQAFAPHGLVAQGALQASTLQKASWAALFFAALLGLPTLLASPGPVMLIALAALFCVFGYSGKPFGFKFFALGDLVVFVLCGPLLAIGMSIAAMSTFTVPVVLMGIFFGFAAMALVHAANLQDLVSDTQRGIRTLATELGFMRARHLLLAYYAFSFAVLCAGSLAGFWSVAVVGASLVGAIPLFFLVRRVMRASGPLSPLLRHLREDNARLYLLLGVLVVAALLLEQSR